MNLEYSWDDEQIKFKKIYVYRTKEKDRYILIGHHPLIKTYNVLYLLISKQCDLYNRPLRQNVIEEDHVFESLEEAKTYLSKIFRELIFMYEAKGIVGFIKFLQGYYCMLFKVKKDIAILGKHKIFEIDYTVMLELFEGGNTTNEGKYKALIDEYDLEIGCYSSYTYDVTSSLNKNLFHFNKEPIQKDSIHQICKFRNTFLWNHFVLQEFDQIVRNKRWILPIIHGYCDQSTIKTLSTYFSVCLIARRSINHAGARYLTRGINEQGYVANFVETEQIVIDLDKSTSQRPACSSFIQIRGSAPVYWYQEPNLLIPKPPIQIHYSDPYLMATKKHVCDLISSYGKYIFMVNLVKANEHTPREQILAEEFDNSIKSLKEELQNQNEIDLGYLHFDMKAQLKSDKEEFVSKCYSLAHWCLMRTGVFLYVKEPKCNQNALVEVQNGIVRSNCIDCLDRTNTFQQLIGEMALGIQLAKINQQSLKFNLIEVNEQVYEEFRKMYEDLGDVISLQYGSSQAHKQNIGQNSRRFELYTSIKRHIKNNVSDQKKQYQIDLFLGIHKPPKDESNRDEPFIWEINSEVTLFPDVKYLSKYVNDKQWWTEPYTIFLEKSNINALTRMALDKSQMKKNNQLNIRKLAKKLTFNFDIIERMTQKNPNSKVKNQNKFIFIIEAPFVKLREKQFYNIKSNFDELMKKPYNNVLITSLEEQPKEMSMEIENYSIQRANSNVEQSPKKLKYPHISKDENNIYKEYLRPKTYDELMLQANDIKYYINLKLDDDEEQKLRNDIKEYLEYKASIPQTNIINKSLPKSDSVYEDKKSFYDQIDVKSSMVPTDSNNQVMQSINVHQPKKISIEQKSVKFLESLLKKNISQTQRLKIVKI